MPRPRKRFAQHWLQSEAILDQIITAANLSQSDRILEIGPGTGRLTRRLLPHVESLVAVEIDRDWCKKLVQQLGEKENFLLLQGDFLSLNLAELLQPFPRFQNPQKVVANIPYNITGPILQNLLGTISKPRFPQYDSIVLLVQKEICDRLIAKPGSKNFGALSVKVQYLATGEKICHVPAKAFKPPPKVDSAVIRLSPYPRTASDYDPKKLENLVKLGFANKRKMLRNNLKSIVASKPLCEFLEKSGINPECRAETLGVEDWITLCQFVG